MRHAPLCIAFLGYSNAWGGLEMNILRLALRLRDEGVRCIMIAREDQPTWQNAQAEGLPCRALAIGKEYTDVGAARRLAHILKSENCQNLVFSIAKLNYTVYYAKRFFYKPLRAVYMQQMLLGKVKKNPLQTAAYRSLYAWVAPGEFLAEQCRTKTNMPKDRIKIAPLGVPFDTFAHAKRHKTEYRTQLNLDADAFYAGITGRIDPGKGQEYFIKALALLKQKGLPIKGLIVGEPTREYGDAYLQKLKSLCQNEGLQDRIVFMDFTKNVKEIYGAIDVFVMASLQEAYGMVTIEAMASGTPVVAARNGGSEQFIEDGISGLLTPPADENALAEALAYMYINPKKAGEMAEKARQNGVERYSARRQTDAFIRLFTRD